MLIKLSDTQWIDSRFIRRLFLQHNVDDDKDYYEVTAELGFHTYVHGLRFVDYEKAVAYLEVFAQAISEATRNEK